MQWNKTAPHNNGHDNQSGPGDVPGAETGRTGEIPIPIQNTTKTLPAKAGSTFPSVRAETQEPCAHWMAQSRQSLYKHGLHAIRDCSHNKMKVRKAGKLSLLQYVLFDGAASRKWHFPESDLSRWWEMSLFQKWSFSMVRQQRIALFKKCTFPVFAIFMTLWK